MPKITFILKDGTAHNIDAPENASIMEVATDHKLEGIEGACGGAMACATCHCYIHPDWKEKVEAQDNEQSDEEIDMLDLAFDVRESSRLGCQIRLAADLDGLTVAMPGTETDW